MNRTFNRYRFVSQIRQIREESYGEDGLALLAEALSIPVGTWENHEVGVVIPDMLLLTFIYLTGANPSWLLTGDGEKYLDQTGLGDQQGRD